MAIRKQLPNFGVLKLLANCAEAAIFVWHIENLPDLLLHSKYPTFPLPVWGKKLYCLTINFFHKKRICNSAHAVLSKYYSHEEQTVYTHTRIHSLTHMHAYTYINFEQTYHCINNHHQHILQL